jgi:hypothetical protein
VIEPVDSQELNRLLAEGDVRLRHSRDILKKNPHRPKDWEEITPVQLQPAIKYLCDEFNSHESQITHRAESGCYLALHPDLAMLPTFKGGFINPIAVEKRALWQQYYAKITEPAKFKFWCDHLAQGLVETIAKSFDRFLSIGSRDSARARQSRFNRDE